MTKHGFRDKRKQIEWLDRKLDFKSKEVTNNYCSRIEHIDYKTPRDRELQHKGIDGISHIGIGSWDNKISFNICDYNKRIIIETKSVNEVNKPGWIYTDQCTLIVFAWVDPTDVKAKTFLPIGYALPLNEFRKTELFKTLEQRKTGWYYPESLSWKSTINMIPIEEFPKGLLIQFNPEDYPYPRGINDWG